MKKWSAFIAIFLGSYLVFLVATMPLALVINTIELPKELNISGVSGSIWQGKISQVSIDNNPIQKIKPELSFLSLLVLAPKVDVVFGGALLDGAEGKFTLTVLSNELRLNDVEIFVPANDIAKQLKLAIPVTAQGNVELTFAELKVNTDKLFCSSAEGQFSWVRSGVVALDNNIKLGTIKADIACDNGDLIATVLPKNNLGLIFNARLSLATQQASGEGYLKPGAKFPAELKATLSFIGRPDNQGRYLLRF